MDEHLHAIEDKARDTPDYHRAMELLEEEEKLHSLLREIEYQRETLTVAGKVARIDRLRGLVRRMMGKGSSYGG